MRQTRDLGRQFLDPARDEGAIDEIAQPGVLRRLELKHRVALERIERRKMLFCLARASLDDCPAEAAIAQQRCDVGEAREAPEPVLLPEEGRRAFADRCVGRVRIIDELWVAGI